MKNIILLLLMLSVANTQEIKMQIYKPVTSSCPAEWITEVKNIIAEPKIMSLMDVKSLKSSIGIPKELYSCNTSILGDYFFEGNVPPKIIKRFMQEKHEGAIGLSLPISQNDEAIKKIFIIYSDKSYKLYTKY